VSALADDSKRMKRKTKNKIDMTEQNNNEKSTIHWVVCVPDFDETIKIKMFKAYEGAQLYMECMRAEYDAIIYTNKEHVIINLCLQYGILPTQYLTF